MSKEGDVWRSMSEEDLSLAKEIFETKVASNRFVCYHSGQAVEKFMKGRLADYGEVIPETHNLKVLLNLLHYDDISSDMRHCINTISGYDICSRYPINGNVQTFSDEEAESVLEAAYRFISLFNAQKGKQNQDTKPKRQGLLSKMSKGRR